jgi:hypothetical protein
LYIDSGDYITDITPITALVNLASTQIVTNQYGGYDLWGGLIIQGSVSPECDLSPLYSMPNYDVSWMIPDGYDGQNGGKSDSASPPMPEVSDATPEGTYAAVPTDTATPKSEESPMSSSAAEEREDDENVAEQPRVLSEYEQLHIDYDITLTNYDVQYDITNSIGEFFTLMNMALRSWTITTNGYRGTESEFFVMSVTPDAQYGLNYAMGSYNDSWYIYADREDYSNVFNLIKIGKSDDLSIGAHMICYMDPQYSESNVKMATLQYFQLDIVNSETIVTWSSGSSTGEVITIQ